MKLVQLVLKTRGDGLIHCGPPCSTWVWVNRATSRRSRDVPEGDPTVQSVASSNMFLRFNFVESFSYTVFGSSTNNFHRVELNMDSSVW